MQFDPTLIVNRVVIKQDAKSVYDERFHRGTNIIRGTNSSGKSTILNSIFYGLGGDLSDWSDKALECTKVFIEVSINGRIATLARDITTASRQPMEIFGGTYDDGIASPRDEWMRYPYIRSENKDSFSQVLFRLLNLPEVKTDDSSNITIHQLLRLLYSDQLSPVESIFKFEQFDKPLIRDAIGRLLCGSYDIELYANSLLIKEKEREFDILNSGLKGLLDAFSGQGETFTAAWVSARQAALLAEQTDIESEIELLEKKIYTSNYEDEITLKAQEEAYINVQTSQQKYNSVKTLHDKVEFEIADSELFINSLKAKLKSLNDSSVVVRTFGDITFSSCPSCYSPIEGSSTAHSCHLCKTNFDPDKPKNKIVSIINNLNIQIKQSELLQRKRIEEFERLSKELREVVKLWTDSSQRLARVQRLPSSETRNSLRELQKRSGYISRELENIKQQKTLVDRIEAMTLAKANLYNDIGTLKSKNDILRQSYTQRMSSAYAAIESEIKSLLRNDLRRQDAFEDARNIDFDFGSNSIGVDGVKYFSASSRVILRSSFYIGFLAAALKNSYFRHPRFCIIDTIEDKGMEPERSQNFQLLIAEISDNSDVDHQIIFATSMIAPQLDEEKYTVGKYSTRDDPTLDFSTRARN